MTIRFGSVAGSVQADVVRARRFYNSFYGGNCNPQEIEVSLDGDIWFEGLRSSLSNGIYEIWIDDIGAGAMKSLNRRTVFEANARYTKDIDPTEQRFSSTRVHPGADIFASNAITPIKTYVVDFFSDPNTYVGMINVIMALTRSAGGSSVEYEEEFIDQGSLDLGALYNKFEGLEIT